MKRKRVFGVIGGMIGFVFGMFAGGYFGLIIGGTFLGSLDLYEHIGIEGYELAAYIGAVMGAFGLAILGVIVARWIADNRVH